MRNTIGWIMRGRHPARVRSAVQALLLTTALASLTAAVQAAEAPRLGLPAACRLNEDCFISTLPDVDPGPGSKDYSCGAYTYNDHDGTDFALRDLAAMEQGVEAVAAAPGRVLATRDGVPDVSVKERGRAAVAGIECGNGVLLAHDGGWQTQYCHLKQGSLKVKSGDQVEAGQPLAQIGLSGDTEYPHLHFAVRRGQTKIDPFQGELAAGCEAAEAPLWKPELRPALAYAPGVIYNAGFAGGPPQPEKMRAGEYRADKLSRRSPALVAWYEVFAVDPGDRMEARILAPDGSVFVQDSRSVDSHKARYFQFMGRKLTAESWPPGVYTLEVRVKPGQSGRPEQAKTVRVTVE